MVKACRKASKILIRDFGEVENLQVSSKGPGNFVTASDKKIEKVLIEELQKARPLWAGPFPVFLDPVLASICIEVAPEELERPRCKIDAKHRGQRQNGGFGLSPLRACARAVRY